MQAGSVGTEPGAYARLSWHHAEGWLHQLGHCRRLQPMCNAVTGLLLQVLPLLFSSVHEEADLQSAKLHGFYNMGMVS
jgi:hypothetical protein